MQPPLGDRLFDLAVMIFIACWAIGWIVLLGLTALQYVFPKRADVLERAMNAAFQADWPGTAPCKTLPSASDIEEGELVPLFSHNCSFHQYQ
jgi:hypothetical protein